MLNDIFTDHRILVQEEAKDWQEAICKVAKPLMEEGCFDHTYVKAMIHLVDEFGAYVVITKGVALAHARPEEGVKRAGLSVMTLRHPVDFGNAENDPVWLVFCLAATDANTHLDIMRDLVRLIDSNEKIQRLVAASDLTSFKRTLFALEGGETS